MAVRNCSKPLDPMDDDMRRVFSEDDKSEADDEMKMKNILIINWFMFKDALNVLHLNAFLFAIHT